MYPGRTVMRRSVSMRAALTLAMVALSVSTLGDRAAHAQDKVRVGKSVPIAWTFTPLDIGKETGIFAKHNIDVEISAFGGDARMQQALAANGIDIGLGSGPGMGFAAKGVPAKAVAAFA